MTTDSCDACRSLDSHASSSLAAPTSPSFASSPSLLLPQTADQQKPTILQPQVLKPTNVQVCAGEVVSTTVSASANTNPSYPTHLTPHSLLSTTHAIAGTTKEISNHSHKPEPQHSMNRSSYKDALVSTLPSHSSYSHSHPHLTSDSHEASHRHHSSSSSRRKRTYSDKDDDSIKSYKRSHHDRKRRSRSRGTRRDAYAPHHKYRRLHTRSPSHDRKASTSSTSYKSHRGNAKFESFSTSYRSRSISSVTPMQALPAKERLPRNPKFSDLPLEWWERGEACKEAKTDHVEKIDYLCKSREFLVLNTTLWTEDTMLELNMFPYDTPPGIAHYTLWSRWDLKHEEVVEFVDDWLDHNFPNVRRWQYDDNSGERSILLFHVHVFVEMDPYTFTPRPGQEYCPPHMATHQ